jgi:sulfur carrier protein
MQIDVHLFATFRQGRFRQRTLEFPPGTTVSEVCQHLAIDPREVTILLVNGCAADRGHTLQSGDEVSLFPAIGGG